MHKYRPQMHPAYDRPILMYQSKESCVAGRGPRELLRELSLKASPEAIAPRPPVRILRPVGQVSDLPVPGVSDSAARGQSPLQPADLEVYPT